MIQKWSRDWPEYSPKDTQIADDREEEDAEDGEGVRERDRRERRRRGGGREREQANVERSSLRGYVKEKGASFAVDF